ncbi:F0F1 ATP synthase subunit B' [Limibaculum sp. M0105]|uniref:ATP synthase subunit b n=1 Tax=Thermohalobaculum xanthum TaxID=2753746 RepID=A0A8J7M966_9RHOB|nr:F0F1 ATP synthase subunit B' [Thermohalobaculum xanthum]MBK0401006.1 F0F1 ATP synthase subunit B' [Thermohalobaculum xanthum]
MATETVGELIHEAAEPHASGGLPQLDFATWPTQIFWLAVALVVLYYLMSRVALPRISETLEERADAIADDLDKAEEFRRRAADAEKAYEQALAEARSKAQAIAAETRAEIQTQVDAALAKADAEISARTAESEKRIREIRDEAAAAVITVATDTAGALIDAVLPEAQDAKAVASAVKARA